MVKGVVRDADKDEAIGYATVAALREGKVLAAVASSEQGVFELAVKESGSVEIEVTSVGYAPYVTTVEADGKGRQPHQKSGESSRTRLSHRRCAKPGRTRSRIVSKSTVCSMSPLKISLKRNAVSAS